MLRKHDLPYFIQRNASNYPILCFEFSSNLMLRDQLFSLFCVYDTSWTKILQGASLPFLEIGIPHMDKNSFKAFSGNCILNHQKFRE
jgi:hypothetical protein